MFFFRVSEPRELQQVDPVYNMKRDFKKKSVFPKKILKNTKNAEETFRVTKQ